MPQQFSSTHSSQDRRQPSRQPSRVHTLMQRFHPANLSFLALLLQRHAVSPIAPVIPQALTKRKTNQLIFNKLKEIQKNRKKTR